MNGSRCPCRKSVGVSRVVQALPCDNDGVGEAEEVETCRAFRCQACERVFPSIDQVAVHLLKMHCSVLLGCPCCEVTAGDIGSLKTHIISTHPEARSPKEVSSECVWCLCGVKHETYCMLKSNQLHSC